MTLVVRQDRGPLRRPTRTGGTVVIEGHAARVHRPGDPLRYAHGDEYRDAAELARLVAQLPGTPVTLGHPPGLLKDGASSRVVGRVDAAWVDGEHAAVRITMTDAGAARAVERGTKELSLGYEAAIDSASYQRETRVDHLAIVSAARCGATCSLLTDEKTEACCEACAQIDRSGESGERELTQGEPMSDPAKTDKQRADELETTVATLNAEVKRLEGLIASGAQAAESEQVKGLQTKLDEANAKIQRFDEALETRADARAALRGEARQYLGAQVRLDGMTDRQIRELVIKRLDASVDVSSENDDQVRGRYNTLLALAQRNTESQARVAEVLGRVRETQRADETPSYEDIEKNAWKKTLQNGRTTAAESR